MHEQSSLENELKEKAEEIREDIDDNPPVIICVGGTADGPDHSMTATSGLYRLRELNGLLDTAKFIENLKHFNLF